MQSVTSATLSSYSAVHFNEEFDSLHFAAVGCGWNRVEYQASAIKEAQGCLCRRSLKEDSGLLMMMTMVVMMMMTMKILMMITIYHLSV